MTSPAAGEDASSSCAGLWSRRSVPSAPSGDRPGPSHPFTHMPKASKEQPAALPFLNSPNPSLPRLCQCPQRKGQETAQS